MIPFFTFSRRSGKTRLAELLELEARRSKHSAEYAALLESARAQQEWRDFMGRMGIVSPHPDSVPACQAAIGRAVAEHNIAKYGYCPAYHFPSTAPSMSTYRIARNFPNPAELEIFKQVLREVAITGGFQTSGNGLHFNATIAQITHVDARFQEILRANQESERVRNTPPPTIDQAAAAVERNAREVDSPPTLRQKNRCYESITQVQIKGPNSGERYTVRVWRSLFVLATAENTSIQQWAGQLNDAIDSMSPVHRKQTVNEAWIISRLEHFTSIGEHRIVAIEVKDSDGCGKLLYPDWS